MLIQAFRSLCQEQSSSLRYQDLCQDRLYHVAVEMETEQRHALDHSWLLRYVSMTLSKACYSKVKEKGRGGML